MKGIEACVVPGGLFFDQGVSGSLPAVGDLARRVARAALRARSACLKVNGAWLSLGVAPPHARIHRSLERALESHLDLLLASSPPLSASSLERRAAEALALFRSVWDPGRHGFHHHFTDHWKELYFDAMMAESLVDWIGASEIRTGVEHHLEHREWSCFSAPLAKKLGIFPEWSRHHREALVRLARTQTSEGSFPYEPPSGKLERRVPTVAPGVLARQLHELDGWLSLEPDAELEAVLLRGLAFARRLPRVPHGGQVWEIDVGVPDALSASNLARLFSFAYARRGRAEDLEAATSWALTALPFLLPVDVRDRGAGIAVIPAFGTTRDTSRGNRWIGFGPGDVQSWWGIACPWIALELAETFVELGARGADSTFRRLAEGLVQGVVSMSGAGGLARGIPDAFNLERRRDEYPMWVVPRNFLRLVDLFRPELRERVTRAAEPARASHSVRPFAEHPKRGRSLPRFQRREYPVHAFVDLTGRCNIKCVICPHTYDTSPLTDRPLMSDTVLARVEKSLFPHVKALTFSASGESLLHPRAKELLARARGHAFQPILIENGTLLDEEAQEILADIGAYLRISVDGASRESFERLRAGAKFDKVFANVRGAVRRAKERESSGFCLRFDATISTPNIDELPDIIDLAAEAGAEQVFYHYVYVDNIPRKDLNAYPHRKRVARRLAEALERGVRHGIYVGVPEVPDAEPEVRERIAELRRALPDDRMQHIKRPRGPEKTYRCRVPEQDVVIKPDGSVAYCCLLATDEHLGSLEVDEFETLWFGDAYRALRDQVSSSAPPAQCHPSRCGVRKPYYLAGKLAEQGERFYFTTLYPNHLDYLVDVFSVRTRRRGGAERLVLDLGVTNSGDTTWLGYADEAVGVDETGATRIGVWLLDADRAVLVQDYLRVDLPRNIPPGESFRVDVELPEDVAFWERHACRIDLVVEGVSWFGELGYEPLTLEGRELVAAARGRPSAATAPAPHPVTVHAPRTSAASASQTQE